MLIERVRFNRMRNRTPYETDEKGQLTLDNLRPGKHKIVLRSGLFASKTLTVDIAPGGTTEVGEVMLDTGGSVTFKSQTFDGKAIEDVIVYPIPEDEIAAAEYPQEVLGYIRGAEHLGRSAELHRLPAAERLRAKDGDR